MSHGLFEQRFVRTAEAAVDLVRYHPEIPNPFFSRRGRSAPPRVDDVSENKSLLIQRYHISDGVVVVVVVSSDAYPDLHVSIITYYMLVLFLLNSN